MYENYPRHIQLIKIQDFVQNHLSLDIVDKANGSFSSGWVGLSFGLVMFWVKRHFGSVQFGSGRFGSVRFGSGQSRFG